MNASLLATVQYNTIQYSSLYACVCVFFTGTALSAELLSPSFGRTNNNNLTPNDAFSPEMRFDAITEGPEYQPIQYHSQSRKAVMGYRGVQVLVSVSRQT